MRAFVITLLGHPYSEACAERCIRTAGGIGEIAVEKFPATSAGVAEIELRRRGLKWTWTTDGIRYCPVTGLRQHPYGGGWARIGCALSHLRLWELCAESGEPILILEHDAVFLRPFPAFEFVHACQVNNPDGCTRRGGWWSVQMVRKGRGIWPKTWVTKASERIPDGLAGNSAYCLKPHAAAELIELVRELGLWPNDAILCEQLMPGLQELYPWVTRVEQALSTTAG